MWILELREMLGVRQLRKKLCTGVSQRLSDCAMVRLGVTRNQDLLGISRDYARTCDQALILYYHIHIHYANHHYVLLQRSRCSVYRVYKPDQAAHQRHHARPCTPYHALFLRRGNANRAIQGARELPYPTQTHPKTLYPFFPSHHSSFSLHS